MLAALVTNKSEVLQRVNVLYSLLSHSHLCFFSLSLSRVEKDMAAASPSVADMASPRRPVFEYGYAQVHADLEANKYSGRYGADHTAYQ